LRDKLKKLDGQRILFTAIVERFGKKTGWRGSVEDTILLKEVRISETGELATDHIWFTIGKTIDNLELKEGDKIQFEARIGEYLKGYISDRTEDYKLNRPTRFKKIV
jgi:hypothetical protein